MKKPDLSVLLVEDDNVSKVLYSNFLKKIIGISNNKNKSKQLSDRIKGFDDTITKPYKADKILPLLDEYLG